MSLTTRCCVAILVFLTGSGQSTVHASAPPTARVAIIIDDLGYGLQKARRVIDLPGPVVCAVLPKTPQGEKIAALAHANGKEVIMHLPMQSLRQSKAPEPAGIGKETSRDEFRLRFASNLASVPHATGVSNHMGSLLTQDAESMRWLMEELGQHNDLFFVDSYTTSSSVAVAVADEHGIPALRRDVFLDTNRSATHIESEFNRALKRAKRKGQVIIIGHPYPATLEFLERVLPTLAQNSVELVPLSTLLADAEPVATPPVEIVGTH